MFSLIYNSYSLPLKPTLFLMGVAKSISISWSLLVTPFSGEGGDTAGTNTEAGCTGRGVS